MSKYFIAGCYFTGCYIVGKEQGLAFGLLSFVAGYLLNWFFSH